MWSDIFLHDEGSNKIAIILLDTQGVYDNQSTAKDCAFIFALSTLVSSVQIYNLSQNIQENDLQHLQLFTEYGRLVLDKSEYKPFQKLQFLVRDWSYGFDYAYGAEGGKKMLANYLQITQNQHEELKSVREHIYSCFSEIECFLMPHPGLIVANKPHFKGQLDLIDDEFKDYLKELVPLILAPRNLKIKEINGQEIRAKDLIAFFNSYVQVLGGDELPKPATIMDATAEANHFLVFSNAKDFYVHEMKKICDSKELFKEQEFHKKHLSLFVQCVDLVSFMKFIHISISIFFI